MLSESKPQQPGESDKDYAKRLSLARRKKLAAEKAASVPNWAAWNQIKENRMNTVQIAIDAAKQLKDIPEDSLEGEHGDVYVYEEDNMFFARIYLGSVFSLDPCGRYHHFLSPNGVTKRCEAFWESLDHQLEKRKLSLVSGEGDPCDCFIVRWLRDFSPIYGNAVVGLLDEYWPEEIHGEEVIGENDS